MLTDEQRFSAELIPSYATKQAITVWNGKQHVHAYYDPPHNGIHLCAPDIADAAATAQRYPMSASLARALFDLAKAEAECPDDEMDFVVDLCIAGEISEDFGSNRQLWPHAIAAWNAYRPENPHD